MHLIDIIKHFPHQTFCDENGVVKNIAISNSVEKLDFYNDILFDFRTRANECARYQRRNKSFSSFTVISGKMTGTTFIKHYCGNVEAYRALTINSLLPDNSRTVLAYIVNDEGQGYLMIAWNEQKSSIVKTPEITRYASRISSYVGIHLWPENFVTDSLVSQSIDVGFHMSNPPRLFVDNYSIHQGPAFEMETKLITPMNKFRNMPQNLYQLQNIIKFNDEGVRLLDDITTDMILDEIAISIPRTPDTAHESIYWSWMSKTSDSLSSTNSSRLHKKIKSVVSKFPPIDDEHLVYQGDFHDLCRASQCV